MPSLFAMVLVISLAVSSILAFGVYLFGSSWWTHRLGRALIVVLGSQALITTLTAFGAFGIYDRNLNLFSLFASTVAMFGIAWTMFLETRDGRRRRKERKKDGQGTRS